MKRHEQHCEAPCQRQKETGDRERRHGGTAKGPGGRTGGEATKRKEDWRTRKRRKREGRTGLGVKGGQGKPKQAKNLSKKDSEGIYGKAIGPEKGTTIIRAHTVGRKYA